jgi:hypothetical protein
MENATHKGSCFCGAVELTVTGEPQAMGYCHCDSCRHWSAGPINAFSLWKPEAVKITRGAEHVGAYMKQPQGTSNRRFCKLCGGHLFAEHPKWNVTDVFAAVLPSLSYKPGLHVNYGEKKVPVKDGLPKMKDFPAEMGGSGQTLPE